MDVKAEIKARLPIEQLVGEYRQLTKKGRNFVCLCPFHNDTHPSFLVSPDKGIGYCFACNTGGDIFAFYQRIENVDFPTAIRQLADKVGVALPREQMSHGPKRDEKERMRMCLEAAKEFFIAQLDANVEAMRYARARGLTDDDLRTFGVGYAPDSFVMTYDHLLKQGFAKTEIQGAGLVTQQDLANDRIYDRFRHRIMFPISDAHGQIVGFGGRALRDGDAKYVNSPEGPLYHKSSVLYGLHDAKESVRAAKKILLVEGYFDVIAARRSGVTNVAAVSGTALTVEHAKLLARYTERVVLCLDQDQAGRQASEKAFAALVKEGLSVDVIRLPAKDPDELAAKDPAALPRLVASSVPYIDTIIDEARLDPNRSTPAGKRDIATRIFSLLAALPSNIERDAYLENVSAVLGISVVTLKEDFALYLKKSAVPSSNATAPTGAVSSANPQFSTFAIALGLLMTHPGERDLVKELLEPFHDDPWKKLYELLKGVPDDASLQSEKQWNDDDDLAGRVGILQLFCEENFGSISQNLARREIRKICKAANRDILKFKQREIIEGLKLARESGRFDEEQQLLVQFEQAMKLLKMAS